MPAVAALIVDRLVGGDGIQPRTHLPTRLELAALQMNLEKRLLKDVFGHLDIAKVMP